MTRCCSLYQIPESVSDLRFCGRCISEADKKLRKGGRCSSLWDRLKSAVESDFEQMHKNKLDDRLISKQRTIIQQIWSNIFPTAIREAGVVIAWPDAFAADVCGDTVRGTKHLQIQGTND